MLLFYSVRGNIFAKKQSLLIWSSKYLASSFWNSWVVDMFRLRVTRWFYICWYEKVLSKTVVMFDVWNKRISKTPSQHPQELVRTLLLLFDGARVHVATSAEKEEMCCWCFISCVSYSILLNIWMKTQILAEI